MNKISIMIFVFLLVLSACNSKTVTYTGENNNWNVTFNVNKNLAIREGAYVEGDYIAKYNGENLGDLLKNEIRYEVNYKSSSSGGATYLSSDGNLEGTAFKKTCSTNCSFSKVEELVFVVIADGNEESIVLKKE
ncbi:hypothetical protein ACLM5H_22545 [Fredinandcohnia humi]